MDPARQGGLLCLHLPGNGEIWQLVVTPDEMIRRIRQWTAHKKRLSFCELTQDGDSEGCFRLHRLPAPAEAEVIRDVLGIRKAYSEGELARRREIGRRVQGNLRRHGGGVQPPLVDGTTGLVPDPASGPQAAESLQPAPEGLPAPAVED